MKVVRVTCESESKFTEDVHQHNRNQGNLNKYFCLFCITKLIRNSEEKNSYIDIKEKSKGALWSKMIMVCHQWLFRGKTSFREGERPISQNCLILCYRCPHLICPFPEQIMNIFTFVLKCNHCKSYLHLIFHLSCWASLYLHVIYHCCHQCQTF